jgi:tRNA(fMet)-specific endonuclease VapC
MIKYMLDTNIVIYVIKRKPIELLEVFNRHTYQMAISSITLAELIHGAEKSSRPEHNLFQVEDFVSRLDIMDYGTDAAADIMAIVIYVIKRADLERKGMMKNRHK